MNTEQPPELYVIQEPEAPAKDTTLHLSGGIRSAAPVTNFRPLGRPWPRQHAWRERVRQISKPDPKD